MAFQLFNGSTAKPEERTEGRTGGKKGNPIQTMNAGRAAASESDQRASAGLMRNIGRMDREACIAAIQNETSAEALEKLLSRLMILDPLEAIRLASAMDHVPHLKAWLGDAQIEHILAKHEQVIESWLDSNAAQTKGEAAIKVRLLNGIIPAKPALAVKLYEARRKNFNEDDGGRATLALATIMSKSPSEAFKTCLSSFDEKSNQARHLKSMLQVGFPPASETEIERLVGELPDGELRKSAIEGLIYGYERRKSERAAEWKKKLKENPGA